jgi:hypothetical protein
MFGKKMSSEIISIIGQLINEEQNVFGVAVIGKSGTLITQTENWDITNDLLDLIGLIKSDSGIGSFLIQGIKYMVVENVPERKIGTNITGKGHVIICPIPIGGTGALICYINPQVSPREALFAVQAYSRKLIDLI